MKKLWGMRHLRYFYLKIRVYQHAAMWGGCGIGLGIPNERDIRTLQEIWEGKY